MSNAAIKFILKRNKILEKKRLIMDNASFFEIVVTLNTNGIGGGNKFRGARTKDKSAPKELPKLKRTMRIPVWGESAKEIKRVLLREMRSELAQLDNILVYSKDKM